MTTNEFRTPLKTETCLSPITNELTAYTDYFEQFSVSLCYKSGFMTTSVYTDDSVKVQQMKEICPPEIWNISVVDSTTNLRWFPSVLGESTFMVHADPTNGKDFKWCVTPIEKITDQDAFLYVDPNDESKKFEYRLATEKSMYYEKLQFDLMIEYLSNTYGFGTELLNKINNVKQTNK